MEQTNGRHETWLPFWACCRFRRSPVVIVSASVGPGRAYSIENAESFVYRRDEWEW